VAAAFFSKQNRKKMMSQFSVGREKALTVSLVWSFWKSGGGGKRSIWLGCDIGIMLRVVLKIIFDGYTCCLIEDGGGGVLLAKSI
jgi:hypothetical protein